MRSIMKVGKAAKVTAAWGLKHAVKLEQTQKTLKIGVGEPARPSVAKERQIDDQN